MVHYVGNSSDPDAGGEARRYDVGKGKIKHVAHLSLNERRPEMQLIAILLVEMVGGLSVGARPACRPTKI